MIQIGFGHATSNLGPSFLPILEMGCDIQKKHKSEILMEFWPVLSKPWHVAILTARTARIFWVGFLHFSLYFYKPWHSHKNSNPFPPMSGRCHSSYIPTTFTAWIAGNKRNGSVQKNNFKNVKCAVINTLILRLHIYLALHKAYVSKGSDKDQSDNNYQISNANVFHFSFFMALVAL